MYLPAVSPLLRIRRARSLGSGMQLHEVVLFKHTNFHND